MEYPNFYERAQAEQAVQHLPGVPEFEAMTLLGAGSKCWLSKKELADTALGLLGRPATDERIMLRYIDLLEKLGFLYKHQFKYQVTPSGLKYLRETRQARMGALEMLNYGGYK